MSPMEPSERRRRASGIGEGGIAVPDRTPPRPTCDLSSRAKAIFLAFRDTFMVKKSLATYPAQSAVDILKISEADGAECLARRIASVIVMPTTVVLTRNQGFRVLQCCSRASSFWRMELSTSITFASLKYLDMQSGRRTSRDWRLPNSSGHLALYGSPGVVDPESQVPMK